MTMPYEIIAPKKKSIADSILKMMTCVTVGCAMAGICAWSINQVGTLAVTSAFSTPVLIHTEGQDVSCIRWRDTMNCFERLLEPMPEPEAELTYEDAKRLLQNSMAKPQT